MDSMKFLDAVLAGKLNMDWYAERIALSTKGFEVSFYRNRTGKGIVVLVSHPFLLNINCVFSYAKVKNARGMKLKLDGNVDPRAADIFIRFFFSNVQIYEKFYMDLESRLKNGDYSSYVWFYKIERGE